MTKSCKLGAIYFAVAVLVAGSVAEMESVRVLWAAAPLLCIALLDAGDEAKTIPEFLSGLLSLRVWPFYLVLLAIVVLGARELPGPRTAPERANFVVSPYMSPGSSAPMRTIVPPTAPRSPQLPAQRIPTKPVPLPPRPEQGPSNPVIPKAELPPPSVSPPVSAEPVP